MIQGKIFKLKILINNYEMDINKLKMQRKKFNEGYYDCNILNIIRKLERSYSFKGASDIFSLGANYKVKTGDLNESSSLNEAQLFMDHQWIEIYSKKYDCYISFGLNAIQSPTKKNEFKVIISSPEFFYNKCREKVIDCEDRNKKNNRDSDCNLVCTGMQSYNKSKEQKKNYANPNFKTLFEGRLNFVQLKILDHIIKKRLPDGVSKIVADNVNLWTSKDSYFKGKSPWYDDYLQYNLPENV